MLSRCFTQLGQHTEPPTALYTTTAASPYIPQKYQSGRLQSVVVGPRAGGQAGEISPLRSTFSRDPHRAPASPRNELCNKWREAALSAAVSLCFPSACVTAILLLHPAPHRIGRSLPPASKLWVGYGQKVAGGVNKKGDLEEPSGYCTATTYTAVGSITVHHAGPDGNNVAFERAGSVDNAPKPVHAICAVRPRRQRGSQGAELGRGSDRAPTPGGRLRRWL